MACTEQAPCCYTHFRYLGLMCPLVRATLFIARHEGGSKPNPHPCFEVWHVFARAGSLIISAGDTKRSTVGGREGETVLGWKDSGSSHPPRQWNDLVSVSRSSLRVRPRHKLSPLRKLAAHRTSRDKASRISSRLSQVVPIRIPFLQIDFTKTD